MHVLVFMLLAIPTEASAHMCFVLLAVGTYAYTVVFVVMRAQLTNMFSNVLSL